MPVSKKPVSKKLVDLDTALSVVKDGMTRKSVV